MSSDIGILVIEWTAYDVVSLQHITLAWISLDGRSYGPEYDQSACRAMPWESPFTIFLSLYHSDTDHVPMNSFSHLFTFPEGGG